MRECDGYLYMFNFENKRIDAWIDGENKVKILESQYF